MALFLTWTLIRRNMAVDAAFRSDPSSDFAPPPAWLCSPFYSILAKRYETLLLTYSKSSVVAHLRMITPADRGIQKKK